MHTKKKTLTENVRVGGRAGCWVGVLRDIYYNTIQYNTIQSAVTEKENQVEKCPVEHLCLSVSVSVSLSLSLSLCKIQDTQSVTVSLCLSLLLTIFICRVRFSISISLNSWCREWQSWKSAHNYEIPKLWFGVQVKCFWDRLLTFARAALCFVVSGSVRRKRICHGWRRTWSRSTGSWWTPSGKKWWSRRSWTNGRCATASLRWRHWVLYANLWVKCFRSSSRSS